MDISEAVKAGLSQGEIATALGVSRVTVNLWSRQKMNPHHLHADKLSERMCALKKAISGGMIPPRDRKRKPRHAAIAEIMERLCDTAR